MRGVLKGVPPEGRFGSRRTRVIPTAARNRFGIANASATGSGRRNRDVIACCTSSRSDGLCSAFQSSVVHGLLQTADYARAGHESAMPRLAPDQIDMQIEAKLTRQEILVREVPPLFAVVLDEAALQAVQGRRYAPALYEGRPVSVWMSLPVRFVPPSP